MIHIFLDCDGVINSSTWLLQAPVVEPRGLPHELEEWSSRYIDQVPLLLISEVLEDFETKVILSSTWRFYFGLGAINAMFQHCGATFIVEDHTLKHFGSYTRAEEIQHYCQSVTRLPTIVIDDDKEATDPSWTFIQTDPRVGFTEADAKRLRIACQKGSECLVK